MGKTVLLLLTAVVISGTVLSLGQARIAGATDESHRENASESFSREMADAATNAVLASALRDRRFATAAEVETGRIASFGGGDFELLSYSVSGPNDSKADFTVRGRFPYRFGADGELEYTEQEVRSVYEWVPPGFPCALSLNSHVGNLDISGSEIGGVGLDGEERPTCYDRRQHDSYRMGSFGLTWDDQYEELADADSGMTQAGLPNMAIPGPGQEHETMSEMYADANAPSPDVFAAGALDLLGVGDRRFLDPHIVLSTEVLSIGDPDTGSDPRIAYFDSSLTVQGNGKIEGAGLLVVNGDLRLRPGATLEWAGMVIVRSREEVLIVDIDSSDVDIRGTLIVDHDAPPPGGHMDLTVWRDYTAAWSAPWGQAVLPWQTGTSPNKKVYAHTHRFGDKDAGRTPLSGTSWDGQSENTIYPAGSRPTGGSNGARRIVFRDPGLSQLHTISGNPAPDVSGIGVGQPGQHERDTRFHEALASLGNEQVYVQFLDEDGSLAPTGKGVPDRYDGASRVMIDLPDAAPCNGTPADLGAACHQSSKPNRSRSFEADQLEGLVVEVGSLRLLRRITDHEPLSPDGDVQADADGNLSGNLITACPPVTDGDSYFAMRDGYCTSNDNPVTMSYFPERKGTLRLQLRKVNGDALVYEASMYWHTKNPNSDEYEEEQDADEAFFDALVNGEAYGVSFMAGDALTIEFMETTLLPLYERFGRNNPHLAHLRSNIQRVTSESAVPTP